MTAFATLWRSFFAQFFSSETVTSDMRLRQGVIWVMAFLVAPGLSIAFRFGTHYQFALHFAPERADGLLLMMMLFVTLAAFPLQFQRALAPAASPGAAGGSARLLRTAAWLAGARRPLARAVSDFVLVTLARNRSAQTIAAINAAVVYWLAVGLRASFYVPSELPASWAFAVNAPGDSSQYRTGVRAYRYSRPCSRPACC